MTIERLQIKPPIFCNVSVEDPLDLAINTLRENSKEVETLGVGTFDVTPKDWNNDLGRHIVKVLENGKGLHTVVPMYKNADSKDVRKSNVKFVKGVDTHELPTDSPMVLISSPFELEKGIVKIHEIIFYLPGPSPKFA